MPKHIARLLVVMVTLAVLALFAKSFFTKDSFYQFGHYRGNSVPAIASMAVSFQTPKACEACHGLRNAEWSAGQHKTVICEVCHGAAPGHPGKGPVSVPAETSRLCTQCHEQMPGRPVSSIKQVGPSHPSAPHCIACHNPHAPRIVPVPAAQPAAIAAGQGASAVCAGCHGANGVSANPEWPNLAGQSNAFLVRALASFQVGARKNDLMGPVGQSLAPADIPALAAYFSSRPCAPPRGGVPAATVAAGEKVAHACTSCHGERGRGTTNSTLPRLAGQSAVYLGNALRQFKAEQRSNPIMAAVTHDLSDADIDGVASYYAAQSCGNPSR